MMMKPRLRLLVVSLAFVTWIFSPSMLSASGDYLGARWDPIHFKPAIDEVSDQQCLACHQEILQRKTRAVTPSGLSAQEIRAWYQTLDTYQGEQDTFHRRHLVTPEARRLMNFRCNTCHQGHDPKDEASGTTDDGQMNLVLRKSVDPDICVMCHGKFDYKVMSGLPGDWPDIRDTFKNDCVTCHQEFRTVRHQLNFLNAEEIEIAGEENSDSCYGCHGGRAWYAIAYPYVRTPWLERMPEIDPEWARGRPAAYDPRFTKNRTKKQLSAKTGTSTSK
ncbi:MAG: hypothetical protein ABW131_10385 [Candidatus Sedimenticola sp. 6PFRAG5]